MAMATATAMVMAMVKRMPPRSRRLFGSFRLAHIGRKRAFWLACVSLLSILLASKAAISAFANVARTRNPSLVDQLTEDPTARLLLVEKKINITSPRIREHQFGSLARESLSRQAINTTALRILALHAAARGQPAESAAFASLSERVSRRDLVTQFLLIQEAVGANDHELALRHYDRALRTNALASNILFPILGSAISDGMIRRAVVPYVRMRASWVPQFVKFSMQNGGTGPRATAELLLLAGVGDQTEEMIANTTTLIGMLVDRSEFPLAQQLILQVPGASPNLLQNATFTSRTTDSKYGPFAWAAASSASVAVTFDNSADSILLAARLFAEAGETGTLLRRIIALPPGHYYLNESRTLITGDDSSRAYWQMTCLSGEARAVIWRGPENQAGYRALRAEGPVITGDCNYQLLELKLIAGDAPEGFDLVIESFNLVL